MKPITRNTFWDKYNKQQEEIMRKQIEAKRKKANQLQREKQKR